MAELSRRGIRLRKLARFLGLALLAVCALKMSLWNVENDIREAAYKHAFGNLGHNRHTWNVSFIGVCYGCSSGDYPGIPVLTTPFLLNRFKGYKPPVKSKSACHFDEAKQQISEKKSGKTGVIFYTGAIRWISTDTVRIEVGYYEGLLSSSGNIYTLKRKNGRWVVVDEKTLFVS